MPERVTSFRYVEEHDKFALMFWTAFHSHMIGACHFDVNLLNATSCQVVAKTVKGFWRALSENIRCHAVSDDFVSRVKNVVKFVSVLRQSTATLTSYVCAFLLNMRHNGQQHYPGCISSPRRTSTVATSPAHEYCDSGRASPPVSIK